MASALIAFFVATLLSIGLTRLVRDRALKTGAIDHALTSRKTHETPVPRLGGVAIVGAFYVAFCGQLLYSGIPAEDVSLVAVILGGGAIIAALGLLDDLRGADPRLKFAVQFAVAAIAYSGGFRIDTIVTPIGPPVYLGILGLPFTMLWIAGVINAINLIDGLDGLASGIAAIAVGVTIAIGVATGQLLVIQVAVALLGAALGFLAYNFHPASIFMGDTGSMFLGFLLALLSIHAHEQQAAASVALVVPVVALGIPIADTALAMVRRAALGMPLFMGDRGHIHHRLLDRGLSHRQTVVVLYVAAGALGASAIIIAFASTSVALWLLLALAGIAYMGLRHLGYAQFHEVPAWSTLRKTNLGRRRELKAVRRRLRAARGLDEVWASTVQAAAALEAQGVGLRIVLPGGRIECSTGLDGTQPGAFRVRYGLTPERPGENQIELEWNDGRSSVERDVEVLIEELCGYLASVVDRLEEGPSLSGRWTLTDAEEES